MGSSSVAFGIRVPKSELKKIDNKAVVFGMSRSEYIRFVLSIDLNLIDATDYENYEEIIAKGALPTFSKGELQNIYRELVAEGNNLNQATRSLNYIKNNLPEIEDHKIQSLLAASANVIYDANEDRKRVFELLYSIEDRLSAAGLDHGIS